MINDIIIGRNPVLEAISAGRSIDKILIKTDPDGSLKKIISAAKANKISVIETDKKRLDAIAEGGVHQGVIAYIAAHNYSTVDDILNIAEKKGEPPFIIICDRITDPHNLGSILRTASGAGAHGVIISKHESVGLNATVAKVSAGAIEFVPVARVTNLSSTIDTLKDKGLWFFGADGIADKNMYEADFSGAVALVIGSEGTGISRIVKEKCDFLVSIPMKGKIESLNASVAAALLMYEVARTRQD